MSMESFAAPISSFRMAAQKIWRTGTFTPHSTCKPSARSWAFRTIKWHWNLVRWVPTESFLATRRRSTLTTSAASTSTITAPAIPIRTIRWPTSSNTKRLPVRFLERLSSLVPPQPASDNLSRKRTGRRFVFDDVGQKAPAGAFSGKIVLVGATATGIGDLRTTPFGGLDYPGVEIHANVIDNILHGNFLSRGAKESLSDLLLIFLFGVPLGIWMALVSPRWMGCGVFLLLLLAAVDYFAFLRGSWLNFTIPALTLTANVILVSLFCVLAEVKEKRRVRTPFRQYLIPEVVRLLLLNPELVEPRKTEITVMFSDIRGFTTISEKLDAQELAVFLNQYLSDMTQIVFERRGTLDKYIGDAVMAFWGAPFEEEGHAVLGCQTALDMMAQIHKMQKKWEAQGKPRLDIGIGLNTGVASVGNMGSSLRYGYTALGDSVNLSSRLEGLNKDYGTHILVNETTYLAARNSGFIFRELDLIRVKGKLQPVVIYELVAFSCDLTAEMQTLLDRFCEARELYRQRRWLEAQTAFQSILDQWPNDGPARAYWKRCQEYLFDEPSTNWDGVFTMTHK